MSFVNAWGEAVAVARRPRRGSPVPSMGHDAIARLCRDEIWLRLADAGYSWRDILTFTGPNTGITSQRQIKRRVQALRAEKAARRGDADDAEDL